MSLLPRPLLIATDLDGTLLRPDGTISPRTRQALAGAEERGIEVVFVTGRPPQWMPEIARATGHRGEAICANGALVYDLHTESVIESRLLQPEALRKVLACVLERFPHAVFAADTRDGLVREARFDPGETGVPDLRVVPAWEGVCDLPAAKVLVHVDDLDGDAVAAAMRDVVAGAAEVTRSGWWDVAELSAEGVSKATALASFCERRGLPATRVWAFGDMPNDLAMLAWAGRSYAVANAHHDVLEVVDDVCPSNEEDGVAQVLEAVLA